MTDRFTKNYGMTLDQFRALSKANRERVIKREPIDPADVPKTCPVHSPAAKAKRMDEYREKVAKRATAKAGGVGWHLKSMIGELTSQKLGCGCESTANEMDRDGPEKVRERLDYYVEKINLNRQKWTWIEQAEIALKAATHAFDWHLDPLNPIRSLVLESIRRAEHGNQHEGQRDGQEEK
jgi:hypothetical protein